VPAVDEKTLPDFEKLERFEAIVKGVSDCPRIQEKEE